LCLQRLVAQGNISPYLFPAVDEGKHASIVSVPLGRREAIRDFFFS
jgi:hypothetical protein